MDLFFIGISTWSWCYALWSSLAFPHEPDSTLYDLQLQVHMNLMLRSMIFNCNSTHPHPIVWGGVGWGGIIASLAFPHELDATLYDLHWHFHMNLMLRSMIFIGISTWSWYYALWSSLAFPHEPDSTLYDLQLQVHMNLMLRSMIFNCNSTHPHPIVWGGVGWGGIITSLAFPHGLVLHWHFHMILMLRSMIIIGISTWTWCYALWPSIAIPHELDATLYDLQLQFHTSASDSLGWGGIIASLAFPHELDATLYDLHWHFHMNLMLRSMIFIGISTWSWYYALWSSLAFPHEPDSTLYDLQLQVHMNLMLRSMIFNCNSTHPHPIVWVGVGWDYSVIGISTWTWCYALWSSLTFPHELDATLYDLHWHFHMDLMLRSMIFIGISTWTWCYALWSAIASPHDLDAMLYDLHWHFHMNLMLRSMIFIGISTWSWCYALWSSMWEKVAVALFEAEVMEGLSFPK